MYLISACTDRPLPVHGFIEGSNEIVPKQNGNPLPMLLMEDVIELNKESPEGR